MSQISIGVIGLGLGRYFTAGCGPSPLVKRLAICDPDQDRRKEVRAHVSKVSADYPSIEEMLDSERLDAVCVVTPDHMHRPHVEICLAAGCHVLMTKPLSTNLEDARAIVRAENYSGKTVMVAHERRFRSRFRAVKKLLSDGRLGDVILIQADQVSDRRGHFSQSPWYASKEAGRSALVGSGIHEVDIVRFLVGKPIVSVSACSNQLGGLEFPKSKTTAAVFQFEGGAVGQTTVSYEAHWPSGRRPENRFLLVATLGIVNGNRFSVDGEDGWVELPTDENEIEAGCRGCVDAFLDAVVHKRVPPVTTEDAYATLAACIAADESAATGKTIVPDRGADT